MKFEILLANVDPSSPIGSTIILEIPEKLPIPNEQYSSDPTRQYWGVLLDYLESQNMLHRVCSITRVS